MLFLTCLMLTDHFKNACLKQKVNEEGSTERRGAKVLYEKNIGEERSHSTEVRKERSSN